MQLMRNISQTRHLRLAVMLLTMASCLFVPARLNAQQLPQYTQITVNPYMVNPALAGTEGFVHIQSAFRSQWQGFDGAPETGYLSLHAPLNNKMVGQKYKGAKFLTGSWISLGGTISYDKTGPLRNTVSHLTLAYNLALDASGLRLSFGLNVGLQSFSFDPGESLGNIPDPGDPLLQGAINQTSMDAAVGFWLYSPKFFLGLSSYQLLENPVAGDFDGQRVFNGTLLRHYFAMAGLKVDLDHDLFAVPSVLVKQVPSFPLSYDLNVKLVWKDDYWVSTSYRNEDSFAVALGLVINKRIEFGYSWDLITSGIQNNASGSSEISLGYRLFIKPRVVCPDEFW